MRGPQQGHSKCPPCFPKPKTRPDPLPTPVTSPARDKVSPPSAAKSLHGGWALGKGHTVQTTASLGCPKGTAGAPTSPISGPHLVHPTALHPISSTEVGLAVSAMSAGALLGAPCEVNSCTADTEPRRAGCPCPRVGVSAASRGVQLTASGVGPLSCCRHQGPTELPGAARSQGPLISHVTPGAGPEPCWEGSRESHQSPSQAKLSGPSQPWDCWGSGRSTAMHPHSCPGPCSGPCSQGSC